MQEASLSSGALGLAIEDGLVVGSPGWWSAVEAGQVRIERFSGVITGVDAGAMGDSQIVRIASDVEERSWVAWDGFTPDLVGRRVEVYYAPVPPKRPPEPDYMVDLLLQVRVAA